MQQLQKVTTGDRILDQIQSNVAAVLDPLLRSSAGNSVTNVIPSSQSKYQVKLTDTFLFINTLSFGAVTILLPDAAKATGPIYFKKTDTSSNSITFAPSGTTTQNGNTVSQTVEGASSYSTSSSQAYGAWLSDGSNWWLV